MRYYMIYPKACKKDDLMLSNFLELLEASMKSTDYFLILYNLINRIFT